MSDFSQGYPVQVQAEYPLYSSRSLGLCGMLLFPKLVLLLPHVFLLYFLNLAAGVVTYVAYWIVFLTGNYPRGMHEFVLGVLRWQTRISAWLFGLVDAYPPFSLR